MNQPQDLKTALDYEAQGRTQDAVKMYRRILKKRPKDQRAHHRMGVLAYKAGDHMLALRHLKSAVLMGPSNAQAREGLGDTFAALKRFSDAIQTYRDVLEMTEKPVHILCKLGDVYRRSGDLDRADAMFRRALGVNPQHTFATIGLGQVKQDRHDFVGAIRTFAEASAAPAHGSAALGRMKRLLDVSVQPWHFPMMSDHARNQAYDDAIRAVVRPGDIVLDIGCGSGLLSMMAARAGAAQVYACDDNPHIAQVAQQIIAQNGYEDRIQVINQRSTDLKVGRDLPRRADVLVCEIFDVSVFGEDALNTIRHAMAHLLTPEARIIPQGINIHAAPVESDGLRARFSVTESCGFNLSAFNLLADRRCIQVPLKHETYQELAVPQNMLSIEFNRDLQLMGGAHASFEIQNSGRLDGFIFWYELELGAGHIISTAPHQEMTHWRQGFLPHWGRPALLSAGNPLECTTQYRRHLLWIEALNA